jgi:hypothetical protein
MAIETFDEVMKAIARNRDRPFHLLLGNGFSMAYDPGIFSYNALHDFVSNLKDPDLSTILGVIETKNFEQIMQQLDTFVALINAFNGDPALREKIKTASEKLKSSLLDAVRQLHPEHVFTVPESEAAACALFLRTFLDTGGKLFSTNYDLLLYWILMRATNIEHVDGFGRDLENPDEVAKGEDQEWSELRWGKSKAKQNVYYLHGALPFFDSGIDIIKEEYDGRDYLLANISARMERGEYPIFVTAGNGNQKLAHIMHNHYLSHCYEALSTAEGSIVSFGFNFGKNDNHIIEAINAAAKHGRKEFPKLLSLYVGAYSDSDYKHIEEIRHQFKCKVHIFDAKTVNLWGRA